MKYSITTLGLAAVLLAGCGGDEPAPKSAAAPAAAPAAPAAPAPPAAEPAMADEDEVKYDPIDVSKLENQWWKQYSSGG